MDLNDVGLYLAKVASQNSDAEPTSIAEAVHGDEKVQWTQAINSEIQSLVQNGTWESATLPPGRKAIGTKIVFKRKLDSDGQGRSIQS